MKSYIENSTLYRRIIYGSTIALILITDLTNKTEKALTITVFCSLLFLFCVLDDVFCFFGYYETTNFYPRYCYIKICIISVMQGKSVDKTFVFTALILIWFYSCFEYLLHNVNYDKTKLVIKKFYLIIPILFEAMVCYYTVGTNWKWTSCFITCVASYLLACYLVNNFVLQEEINSSTLNKIKLEKSNIEHNNEQLLDYQNKIKSINEQINYQRIDLERANKELEQANIEIESQTEVMKYMASTFNVFKCMSVIAESIMEIKKPKICAMYIHDDVFMNKYPSSIIKTNYTSIETRLNRDISKIYTYFNENKKNAQVYKGEDLKQFRFIGEANINSLAILPIINGYTLYGIMIIGSDKENYFDKGLTYFETSIVEFNISVKSIQLYLQMQDMARKDGLTGIYNRVYFNELFSEVASESSAKNLFLSVALYDIDKFKNVNDTYGHLAGDEVIKMVASTGEKYAERYNGFTCRYGGEEFLLVLPGKDEKIALSILEEMHQEIKNTKVKVNNQHISVDVCIGLSSYPNLCDNTNVLISRADKAMYYGKKNGRGRLVVDDSSIE